MVVMRALWACLLLPTVWYLGATTLLLQLGMETSASAQVQREVNDKPQGVKDSARVIESRLRAPCCWTQTIDVHDSEVSRELHREIVARLEAGESGGQIENVLVGRYGARLRAVPAGSPLYDVALGVAFVVALAALALFVTARRWRLRSRGLREVSGRDGELDEYDERLRRELEELS